MTTYFEGVTKEVFEEDLNFEWHELIVYLKSPRHERGTSMRRNLVYTFLKLLGAQKRARYLYFTENFEAEAIRILNLAEINTLEEGHHILPNEQIQYLLLNGKVYQKESSKFLEIKFTSEQSIELYSNLPIHSISESILLKLSKIAFNEFLNFVYEYQQREMQKFLWNWFGIGHQENRVLQIENKIKIHFILKQTNIKLNNNSLYILRHGSVQIFGEKLLYNEGALFYGQKDHPELVSTAPNTCLFEIDEKLLVAISNELKDFLISLKLKIDTLSAKRKTFLQESAKQLEKSQTQKELKVSEMLASCIKPGESKRFRKRLSVVVPAEELDLNFAQIYPYEIMLKAKQKVKERKVIPKIDSNCQVMVYLNANKTKQRKHNDKILKLKLKSKAQKELNVEMSEEECEMTFKNSVGKSAFFNEDLAEYAKENIDSKETFFSGTDTGLINQFAKHSYIYQKEIATLLEKNARLLNKKLLKPQFETSAVASKNIMKSLEKQINYRKPKEISQKNDINLIRRSLPLAVSSADKDYEFENEAKILERCTLENENYDLVQTLPPEPTKKMFRRLASGKIKYYKL